ncbi:hypothetical protein JCM11641_007274 [Rhodosporidiobolus odoratus]
MAHLARTDGGTDVIMYLSSLVGKVQPSTIRRKYDSLLAWHICHLQPLEVDNRAFKVLMRWAVNTKPGKTAKRSGISIEDLTYVAQELLRKAGKRKEEEGYWSAIQACLLAAHWGMTRLGGLTTPRNGQTWKENEKLPDFFDPKNNLHGECFKFFCNTATGMHPRKIDLPWTKTEHLDGDIISITDQNVIRQEVCPVQAITRHLIVNELKSSDPGFSYLDRNHRRKSLTLSVVVREVNQIHTDDGRNRIWGHSLRTAGLNFFAAHGAHPDRLRQVSRWASNAIDAYYRDQHITAIKHLGNIELGSAPASRKKASRGRANASTVFKKRRRRRRRRRSKRFRFRGDVRSTTLTIGRRAL